MTNSSFLPPQRHQCFQPVSARIRSLLNKKAHYEQQIARSSEKVAEIDRELAELKQEQTAHDQHISAVRSQAGSIGGQKKWGTLQDRNTQLRSERLANARKISQHSKFEWRALLEFCGHQCVKCGEKKRKIVKDHILPIYQGGSDGLENLQPLCAKCNSAKGPESRDYRQNGWQNFVANALGDFARRSSTPHARSRSINEDKYEEIEEAKPVPEVSPTDPPDEGSHRQCRQSRSQKPKKRQWEDPEILRARGCDQSWAAKLGLYLLAKELFLAMHPAPGTYFWDRFDAYWVAMFLQRRPNLTEAELRVMLANYHASKGANRFAAAQNVFRVLHNFASAAESARIRRKAIYQPTAGCASTGTYGAGAWSPEAIAARQRDEDENERNAYDTWRSMKASYREANPWRGRVFAEEVR